MGHFCPPPVFCPTPGALIGTATGPESKSKGTTGKIAERRPTPPPSAAALDLTEAGCGPRPVRRKIVRKNDRKFLMFFSRFFIGGSYEKRKKNWPVLGCHFLGRRIFGPMVIVLARLILSETLQYFRLHEKEYIALVWSFFFFHSTSCRHASCRCILGYCSRPVCF